MNDSSFLSALAPGNETFMFWWANLLLLVGIASVISGLVLARRARRNKSGAAKFAAKSGAFSRTIQGLLIGSIGGTISVANFVPATLLVSIAICVWFLAIFLIVAVLIRRYLIADRDALNARMFDMQMWHFFNG